MTTTTTDPITASFNSLRGHLKAGLVDLDTIEAAYRTFKEQYNQAVIALAAYNGKDKTDLIIGVNNASATANAAHNNRDSVDMAGALDRVVNLLSRLGQSSSASVPATAPAVPVQTTSSTSQTAPAPLAPALSGNQEQRITGLEARAANAEANLGALNGAVGIAKSPDGSWLPTPDGQFTRNSQVLAHLGYNRANDGTVTFTNATASNRAEQKLRIWPTVIVFIAAFILFWIPLALGWGMVWAAGVATAVMIIGIVTILVTNNRP